MIFYNNCILIIYLKTIFIITKDKYRSLNKKSSKNKVFNIKKTKVFQI